MKTCNTAYQQLVEDVLRRILGSEVKALIPVPTYPDTIVYEAATDHCRVVFKAVDPDGRDRDGISLEAWAHEKSRQVGIPTPQILEVDTSRARFPASFFVMQRALGESLAHVSLPPDDLRDLLLELGAHLRALHEIQLPGFGWLDEDVFRTTGEVRGWAETWRSALLEDVPESLEYLVHVGSLTSAEVEHAQMAVDSGSALVDGWTDGRLLHGDLGLLHVWIEREALRVTSVIDFGDRSAGDPAYDFEDFEPEHLRQLMVGYEREGLTEEFATRVAFYALVRALPWARKWHQRGEERVIGHLRHVLRLPK